MDRLIMESTLNILLARDIITEQYDLKSALLQMAAAQASA